MNKKIPLLITSLTLGCILFSSYEHGPAYEGTGNRTGSTGGAASCAGSSCHSANTATTIVQLSVKTMAGATVTTYTPGTTYQVTISAYNTTETVDKFGFQVSGVLAAGVQAGNFAVAASSKCRVTPLGSLQIVEHKQPLGDTTANHFIAHFYWTAPAAGSGNVTFHGIVNAFGTGGGNDDNNNNNDDNNDNNNNNNNDNNNNNNDDESGGTFPNAATPLMLTESGGGSSNGVATIGQIEMAHVFPNPCTTSFSIKIDKPMGQYSIRVHDMSGKTVLNEQIDFNATGIYTANTRPFVQGVYIATVTNGSETQTFSLIKQ